MDWTSDGVIFCDCWAEYLAPRARSATARGAYSFHIRVDKTSWKHLFLVCRPQDPSTPEGWTCKDELARCGMALGYVSRERFEAAMPRRGQDVVRVSVTPWGENARNWLGKHVAWARLEDVTRAWWWSCPEHATLVARVGGDSAAGS